MPELTYTSTKFLANFAASPQRVSLSSLDPKWTQQASYMYTVSAFCRQLRLKNIISVRFISVSKTRILATVYRYGVLYTFKRKIHFWKHFPWHKTPTLSKLNISHLNVGSETISGSPTGEAPAVRNSIVVIWTLM